VRTLQDAGTDADKGLAGLRELTVELAAGVRGDR
jgi:hypothetical protein